MRKETKARVMMKRYDGTFDDYINILLTGQSMTVIAIVSKQVYTLVKISLKCIFLIFVN